MKGSNGLRAVENAAARDKCPHHPTKRKWCDGSLAREEADRRSTGKLRIEAYLCDGCGCYHLTRSTGGDSAILPDGKLTVGEFQVPPVERVTIPEDEPPTIPGDHLTRVRAVRAYLATVNAEPTTVDLMEHLVDCSKGALSKVMADVGYVNTRGRKARWVPAEPTVEDTSDDMPPEAPAPPPPVAIHSDRASVRSTWRNLSTSGIGHIAVGDLIDTYRAAGLTIRIQVEMP